MYPQLANRAMAHKLRSGEAIDLKDNERDGDFYILTPEQAHTAEHDTTDFCDSETESWIWSVGESNKDKKVYASTTSCFYQHPDYRCIWLR